MIHTNYLNILTTLYNYGVLSAREISDQTGIDHTNIYDYLERLCKVGWIVKEYGSLLDVNSTYKYRLSYEGTIFLNIYPVKEILDNQLEL